MLWQEYSKSDMPTGLTYNPRIIIVKEWLLFFVHAYKHFSNTTSLIFAFILRLNDRTAL